MSKYIVLYGTNSEIKGKADTLEEALILQGGDHSQFSSRIYKQIDVKVIEASSKQLHTPNTGEEVK